MVQTLVVLLWGIKTFPLQVYLNSKLIFKPFCTFVSTCASHQNPVLNCLSGRVSVLTLTKKQRKEQKKMDRRHKANQLRKNKKDMVIFTLKWRQLLTDSPVSVEKFWKFFFLAFSGPDREKTSWQQGRSSSFGRCGVPSRCNWCSRCHQTVAWGGCWGHCASGTMCQWHRWQFWTDSASL